MHFARKEPRVSVSCVGAFKAGKAETAIGRVLDLSAHGMGVQLAQSAAAGTRVYVRLDPRLIAAPPLSGVVVNCIRRDHQTYRLSLFVACMPDEIRRHIREAGSPTTMVVVRDDAVRTTDPRAREALYQAACARLEARQFEPALRAAARALNADPENRRYQALVHRALAEAAHAEGRHLDAVWEVEKARACTPHDQHILVLRERVCGRRRERVATSIRA